MSGQREYIEPAELALLLRTEPSSVCVIDVREEDYSMGRIKGSRHVPFWTFPTCLDKLAVELLGYKTLVVHCYFSQTRGPTAADLIMAHFLEDEFKKMDAKKPRIMILKGGFKTWKQLYHQDLDLYEVIAQ